MMMNKIGHIFKCQQGFPIPQNLRRFGVNYHVMNLMGAFTDASLPVDKKDELLETFYNKMEQAAEEGMGVLLCSFQDLTWACFNVVAFWMRKYLWTVDHAVSVMKSRRATLVLEQNCMTELHLLAERISKRFPKRSDCACPFISLPHPHCASVPPRACIEPPEDSTREGCIRLPAPRLLPSLNQQRFAGRRCVASRFLIMAPTLPPPQSCF